MANISQITLPDTNTYDIRDAKKSGVYTVVGTQTEATAAWTGELHGVSALYDGLTINYYLPWPGVTSTNVTLNLTLDSGSTTGAKNVFLHTSRLTTHYSAGRVIIMSYWSKGSITVSGTAISSDRWICDAFYDLDTKVRQQLNTANTDRPLLMSYADISNTTTNVDNVSYRNNTIYANPSTGNLHVLQLNGTNVSSIIGTTVSGTLTAGQTSITLSNSAITTSSTFEFFTDKFGVVPTGATVSAGSIVLTFTAQTSSVGVKVKVT